jgi:DNA-binding CsgD family transcriptional regulator
MRSNETAGTVPSLERWRVTRAGRDRKIDSASAAMARMARRRNPGYQRVDPHDLRAAMTIFATRFYDAVEGGPIDPALESLSTIVRKRMRQGLHPLEVFGAWSEVRNVLQAALGEETRVAGLLDRCEEALIGHLKDGVDPRPPYTWPAHEVRALRREVERLNIGLELIEQTSLAAKPSGRAIRALTRREREILTLASGGMTTDRIAAEVGISRSTVRTYVTRSIAKLGAENRTHAIALAVSLGVIIPPDPER